MVSKRPDFSKETKGHINRLWDTISFGKCICSLINCNIFMFMDKVSLARTDILNWPWCSFVEILGQLID